MPPRLALRAALAWLVLTLLVSLWGPQAIVAVRPLVQATVEWMLPGFITRVTLKPPPDDCTNRTAAGGDLAMQLQAMAPVQIAAPLGVHPWVKLTQSINAGHGLKREPPFVLTQLLFNEIAGQWLAALVRAIAVAAFVGRRRAA